MNNFHLKIKIFILSDNNLKVSYVFKSGMKVYYSAVTKI